MNNSKTTMPLGARAVASLTVRAFVGVGMVGLVMGSAVWAKRAGTLPALVGFERSPQTTPSIERVSMPIITTDPLLLPDQAAGLPAAEQAADSTPGQATPEQDPQQDLAPAAGLELVAVEDVTEASPEWDASTRWFDGRPVRPSKVLVMKVTGYSPDSRSCGDFADGQTATLHSVWTNAMQLVAADPSVLPYGSMITVPGYAEDTIVPVLDCGGAIKGPRLDLLFATHDQARRWGVRTVRVTVWDYADGLPAPNPREVR